MLWYNDPGIHAPAGLGEWGTEDQRPLPGPGRNCRAQNQDPEAPAPGQGA